MADLRLRARDLIRQERDTDLRRLFAVTVQLGIVLVVARLFSIEEAYGFLELVPLLFVGFVIHALLPRQARLPFFLLLSVIGIVLVLGRSVGAMVIGLGAGLLAICHLPFRFGIRVGLLVAVGLVLAAARAGWMPDDWTAVSALVLPVLGAMFMFRLIIYMYELRHEAKRATIWERLSYFFMLPNVCFLLFPVVDYRTFRRTYYDGDPAVIYQKGVGWMLRGITHLLLYRVTYYEVLPSASDVVNLSTAVTYMAATYLLYLRISGQFHLIVGVMCLFGFNLPETHHLYLLASSFSDYWRRINIYWKDFMMKIFYYPSLNRLRKRGLIFAIVTSTLIVFAGTWILHSYQWFWLQGQFPIAAPDALFWGILGLLVVLNALRETKQGRRRTLGAPSFSWKAAAQHAGKVVGMLVVITVLWTMWSSHSLTEFAAILRAAGQGHPTEFLMLAAGLAMLVGIGVLVQYLNSRGISLSLTGAAPTFQRASWSTSLGAGVLLLLALPSIRQPPSDASAFAMLASLHRTGLNAQDEQQQLMGYYEGLLDARNYMAARWDVRGKVDPPADWGDLSTSNVTQETGDFRQYELRPGAEDFLSHAGFKVNRWGMRDRDYEQQKPPSTFRIAMLGASYVVGAGVEQEQSFEALLEDRLNREIGEPTSRRIESLNMAVGGYDPVRTLVDVRRRLPAFEPDMVCLIAHLNDGWRLRQNLVTSIQQGLAITEPHVRSVVESTGVDASMARSELERRLDPVANELLQWSYRTLGAFLRERGIEPVAFLLPRVIEADEDHSNQRARVIGYLQEAGFSAYDLWDVFGDIPTASLWLGPWDEHPNVLGHRLISEAMFDRLVSGGHFSQATLADDHADGRN